NPARGTARFGALWHEAAGMLPDWLRIDPSLEHLLVAWWNAPTWRQSRDYLAAHRALLDPGTDILIDEFRQSGMDESLVSKHLRLLADARTVGIESAFAATLAKITLDQWRDQDLSSEH